MPPSFPHAVFTPDDSLAVGGQFYTTGHLGRSIEGLRLQEDYPDVSNEELSDSVYGTLAGIFNNCSPVMTSSEKSQVVSSRSLFPGRPSPPTYDEYSKERLTNVLESFGVAIPSRASKRELLELLIRNSSTRVACTPREAFLDALEQFCERFMDDRTMEGDLEGSMD
jgi:hypothetical protein